MGERGGSDHSACWWWARAVPAPQPLPHRPPPTPVRAAVVCLQDITADIICLSPAIDQYQVLMMLGVVLLIMEFVVFVDFLFGDLQVPVPSSACTPPPPPLNVGCHELVWGVRSACPHLE